MRNSYFRFKEFIIYQDECSMKVTTDSCLFGAWVAKEISDKEKPTNILDVGSGSGLLTLMLAQVCNTTIDGIELQQKDYEQSISNVTNSSFADRINLFNADARIFDYTKKYDTIISNPPFYENDLKGSLLIKNIAHHDDGLKLNELITLVKRLLNPTGSFYLLLPAKRRVELISLMSKAALYIHTIVEVRQAEKHNPFRIMVKISFDKKDIITDEIIIKQNNTYSETFIELLRPYYLHLDG